MAPYRRVFLAITVAAALAGCASKPQRPVQLASSSLAQQRIGVAMTALPKVEVQVPGAGCLLCLAAANLANLSLSKHADTLGVEDLPALKEQVAQVLRRRGAQAVVIAEPLDLSSLPNSTSTALDAAKKDFAALKARHGVDKLLVLDVQSLGFVRTYSSYIPTSDPKAWVLGTGFLVNLANNTYEWYRPVNALKAADGKWDEPPKFPGLTNAYFQALEIGKDGFLKPLDE